MSDAERLMYEFEQAAKAVMDAREKWTFSEPELCSDFLRVRDSINTFVENMRMIAQTGGGNNVT